MQAGAWFGKDEEAEFQMLVRWCAALGYILNAHLCGAKEFGPEAEVGACSGSSVLAGAT